MRWHSRNSEEFGKIFEKSVSPQQCSQCGDDVNANVSVIQPME